MNLPSRLEANVTTVASVIFTGLTAVEVVSFILTTIVIVISIVVNILALRNKKGERLLNEIKKEIADEQLRQLREIKDKIEDEIKS